MSMLGRGMLISAWSAMLNIKKIVLPVDFPIPRCVSSIRLPHWPAIFILRS